MGIYSVLNIAKGSVFAAQTCIQVTANNISNVNTEGYSRQEARLDEAPPIRTDFGVMGNGVNITGVKRYSDKFLEASIQKKNTNLAEQETYTTYLERIEGILNEDNSQLTNTITNFFNSWQELSADPRNTGLREAVVTSGQTLAQTMNIIYDDIKNLQVQLNNDLGSEVADTNRIISAIADLNALASQTGDTSANDYLDKRGLLLNELSRKLDIVTFEDDFGRATVLTASGATLVDGANKWLLNTTTDETTGYSRIAWDNGSGDLSDITERLGGGKLKALVYTRDTHAGEFIDKINEIARTTAEKVNEEHKKGYDLHGDTNIAFFKETESLHAKNMAVSDDVAADATRIATTSDPDNTTGNDIALSIAGIIDRKIFNGNTATITDYTSSMTSRIGQLTLAAQDALEYSKDTMQLLESQRASVSGVSLDEELTNLIKYQYAYQASSKLLAVVDELLDNLIAVAG